MVVEGHLQKRSAAVQICKGADKLIRDPQKMILDRLGGQGGQGLQEDQLQISCLNPDREESHLLENLVAEDLADLISAPRERKKGEGAGDKKSFNRWTRQRTPLKTLRSLKEK